MQHNWNALQTWLDLHVRCWMLRIITLYRIDGVGSVNIDLFIAFELGWQKREFKWKVERKFYLLLLGIRYERIKPLGPATMYAGPESVVVSRH